MIVQKSDFQSLIRQGVSLGKRVAVGGPFATSIPTVAQEAGAHYLILDEGECTIPLFLDAVARGETEGIFRSAEKPDVSQTPIPRFDLLDLDAYLAITVQFSRGCPFQCEFCDIINLYGRKPRTKTPAQFLAELEVLYQMGWHRYVFIVDDNFIGNTHNAKLLLRELIPWQVLLWGSTFVVYFLFLWVNYRVAKRASQHQVSHRFEHFELRWVSALLFS